MNNFDNIRWEVGGVDIGINEYGECPEINIEVRSHINDWIYYTNANGLVNELRKYVEGKLNCSAISTANSLQSNKYMIGVLKPIPFSITKVIFNNPATIVFWSDGSKTVVKCENEEFDPEKGLAMAISKKALGNKGNYFNVFKKWTDQYYQEEEEANNDIPHYSGSLWDDIVDNFNKSLDQAAAYITDKMIEMQKSENEKQSSKGNDV